ncbi:MAG TPA: prolipoprotein diacylglyceryl transferase family protein [Actinomycetota bacterium]
MDIVALVGWPILDRIELGPLSISPHGIGIAIGYLLGSWWMLREGPKRGVKDEHVGTIVLWALIGAIIGARGFYVLGHVGDFDSVADMLAVWRGGISLIGGILGAMIVAYPIMRRYHYRFAQVMDSGAVGLAFGIGVGRIGDLIIGDHLGKPTSFFLGWAFKGGDLPGPWAEVAPGVWEAALPRGFSERLTEGGATLFDSARNVVQQGPGIHQTALYDMLIALGLFAFLYWLSRKPRREGVLIATFAVWYGAGRVLTDFLRIDKTWLFGLTGSQWTAIGAITLGLGTLAWFAIRPKPEPEPVPVGGPGEDASLAATPTTSFTPPAEPATPPAEPAPGVPPAPFPGVPLSIPPEPKPEEPEDADGREGPSSTEPGA